MKKWAGLITLVVTVALAGQADAANYRKKKYAYVGPDRTYQPKAYRQRDDDDSASGYYEHRLEAVRFGSQRWWRIYDEHSGGSQHR